MRRLYPLILVLLYFKLNEGAKPEDCLTGTKATTNGCEDENECEFGNRCGPNANCYNTNGSFYCLCEPGHRTRSKKVNFTEGQCKDINECLGDHQICGENTVCNNTLGSFNCSCAAGFVSSNGQKWLDVSQNVTCVDIDECKNRSLCGNNSECNNTPGSYFCTCDPGFLPRNKKETFNASQGVTCTDIDECLEDKICGHNAKCHNTPGSSYCTCNLGFRPSNGQKQFDVFKSVTCEGEVCVSFYTFKTYVIKFLVLIIIILATPIAKRHLLLII
ncbi:adhesion G protein-coupled receptor E2 isoform X1 [Trichomycterus rosablanca]|uniref:adhesion G protein-coupled receptor E2 isoform X1 n=1 Tax=Trichomycterus rosablanca TaxID=2290929 RepID=UPI002F354596